MDTCGIPASKRFAFYDQVHTTGMDIKHSLDATAVLTLGKDMNFRDYVQGSFRMRGIGQGQQVVVFIIPEVAQLIEREVKSAGMTITSDNMLEQVTAWLVISSMRSERVQNNQLMVQNIANVWRKEAFREVKGNVQNFEDVGKHQAIAAFCAGLESRLEESKRSSVEESIATVVFVDHLPTVVPLKVKKLESMMRKSVFKRVQSKITRVEIPTDPSGKTQGMAFVEFASEDDAVAALSAEGEHDGKGSAEYRHKPDGFQFDKQHTLKACPLKEQVVATEDLKLVPQSVMESLRVFEEEIDFALAGKVPEPVPFDGVLQAQLDAHRRWLDEDKTQLIQDIVDSVRGTRISNYQASLEAEQTQEQEEEREKELEDEKEKEIEIEKFSDAAYSRDNETPIPWEFATLADESACSQFYGADEFKLFKRRALNLPRYAQFSSNYFNPKWGGERRLKNVVMLMEWVPSASARVLLSKDEALTDAQEQAIDRAIDLFIRGSDRLARTMTADDATTVMTVISAACDLDIKHEELKSVVRQFRREQTAEDSAPLVRTLTADQEKGMQLLRVLSRQSSGGPTGLDRNGIRRLLLSAKFREEYSGHFTVAVSLSEAATIRRIMHLRSKEPELVIGSNDTALALRVLPAGNVLLDSSQHFKASFLETPDSRALIRYQQEASCEVMRFINCEMHYSEPQLNILLRLLKHNKERERRRFFSLIIGCRRRLQLKFSATPVMKLFSISDEWVLLKHRALSSFVRERFSQLGVQYGDAFTFIRGKSPIIKAQHLLGAFVWLGDSTMTPREVVDFLNFHDRDKDGGWNFDEFVAMLNTNVDEDEEEERETFEQTVDAGALLYRTKTGSTYDYIAPMRTTSIARLESADAKERQLEEAAEAQTEREELEAIVREAQAEEERLNLSQPGGPNPRIEFKSEGQQSTPWKYTWWFTRPRDPMRMKWGGSGNVSSSAVRTAFPEGEPPLQGGEVTRCMGSSYIRLPIECKRDPQERGAKLDRYSLSLHVRLESSLPKGRDIMAILGTKDEDSASNITGIVSVDAKGDVRFSDGTSLFGELDDARVHIKRGRWYVISISIDAPGTGRVWINGKPHCRAEGVPQITRQGMHSLGETACVFGSSEKKEMIGVKLITMMTLQLNVLDDECARAIYDGPTGLADPKGNGGVLQPGKAGEVSLARLYSAIGYEEGEARIERLRQLFAEQKAFSRAEVRPDKHLLSPFPSQFLTLK